MHGQHHAIYLKKWALWLAALLGLTALLGLALLRPQPAAQPATQPATQPASSTALLDAQSCQECHAQQVSDWLGSHHEQAMQPANSETVLGDFQQAVFNDDTTTTRFFQQDGQFIVNTIGEDGKYADFTVRYTFGITPLQQYLLELPRGRLQAFTVAWDTQKQRWFSLYPDETFVPGDRLHWTSRNFIANSSCIDCFFSDESNC